MRVLPLSALVLVAVVADLVPFVVAAAITVVLLVSFFCLPFHYHTSLPNPTHLFLTPYPRDLVRVGQQQVNFGPIGPPPKPATGSGPGLRGKAFTVSSSGASSSARGGGAPLNPYEALMDFGDREEDKVVDGGSAKRSNNTSDES